MSDRVLYHPRAVHARISSSCNLACGHCERELLPPTASGKRRKGEMIVFGDGRAPLDLTKDMSEAVWTLITEKLMPHTENMELGGLGEPTIAPIFATAARDILNAGKNLFFFTNGHYLGRSEILDCVGDTPRVSVSIDAGTEDAYRRIRRGELAHLIENVHAFREAKPGAVMLSQFTATAANIDELPHWVSLCARLGIGRHDHGEEILMVGADHHATPRSGQSIRFFRDRTLRMIDEARAIAEREGLWFIAKPPRFSEFNANAGEDGSDPKGWRRYSDFLMGEAPCGGDTTVDTTGIHTLPIGTSTAIFESGTPWYRLPSDSPLNTPLPQKADRPFASVEISPRELYVDHTGEVWSCLGRHRIGDVRTGNWENIVERNDWYQKFLGNWARQEPLSNGVCMACPRMK